MRPFHIGMRILDANPRLPPQRGIGMLADLNTAYRWCLLPTPEIIMSKSHDTKKAKKKEPQKTLAEKRQAKKDKKNVAKTYTA